MKSIALIACSKTKNKKPCCAKELYIGDKFKKSRRYVEKIHDDWFILSGLYGLVCPDEIIEPYDYTLKSAKKAEKVKWSQGVYSKLKNYIDNNYEVYIYAGDDYRKYLLPLLEKDGYKVKVPMEGLSQGHQNSWLKKQLGE